ncbi:MAG: GlsB/YeaQ/YmgE family stress response membrane protein [Chloroflexota bacterium]
MIQISELITWLVIGAIAGAMANVLLRGRHMGLLAHILLGLVGAFIGGLIFSALHISLPAWTNAKIELQLADIIIAFIGAVVVLAIALLVYRRRV